MSGNGSDTADLLKAARERLSADERKIVKRIVAHYELDLIDSLPEMLAGLRAAKSKQASYTETITMKRAKGNNFSVVGAPRVRAPKAGFDFAVHIDESNQLALGWVEAEDAPEGDEPEIGLGREIGFDDSIDDGAFH